MVQTRTRNYSTNNPNSVVGAESQNTNCIMLNVKTAYTLNLVISTLRAAKRTTEMFEMFYAAHVRTDIICTTYVTIYKTII